MPPPINHISSPRQVTAEVNDPIEPRDNGLILPDAAADTVPSTRRELAQGQIPRPLSSTTSISQESFRSAQDSDLVHHQSPNQTPSSPSVSSQLNSPQSSTSAADLANSSSPSGSGSSRPDKNVDESTIPLPNLLRPPPIPTSRPSPQRPIHSRRSETAGTLASSSQTPRTLSELGRDYSRYPFPSQRSSVSFPKPPPLRHNESGTPTTQPSPPSSSRGNPTEGTRQIGDVGDCEKSFVWLLDDRLASASFAGDANHKYLLYVDEKEADDDLHNPRGDDDVKLKPKLGDFFQPRQLASLFGLIFLLVGLFSVFILLPVLSYTGHAIYSYPTFANPGFNDTAPVASAADHVNDVKYPLFQNIRNSLIDPDTPSSAKTRKSSNGEELQLVFSDEFHKPNRTFYPGDDPFWTAQDLWYGSTQDLEWYDPDAVTTEGSTLTLRLDSFPNHGLNYRSGMINSWNQVCMQGGLLEISVSLPGPGGAAGLWPGAWTMGNLGRPGYKASTEGLWPYTYDSCDAGITPNQSMTDGTSYLPGQKLPSCTCPGEDHPTPGTGRGAPELDVLEASADPNLKLGVITQSYQVAPFDIWYHPNYDHFAIPNYNVTQMNGYCGGPFQQAVSAQTELNNDWYDGKLYQKYGFDYTPGSLSDGTITWFVGDDVSFMINGNAVGPNGNVDTRPISNEPMAMVLNLGFSTAWTGINYDELRFPTTMYVDYVRWYQRPGRQSVTCDPPGYETTDYIKGHANAYHNYNMTFWNQTGYKWPKHKLNTDC